MNNTLNIPSKIKVGYNERSDTYTKKLAYVIYYDNKGKLRKEPSWQGWRNQKLGDDDYDNIPTEGFILNRNGGGARESYGWNARNEFVRVYDPRGFEFEISIGNLLFILQECTSTKGKGLEGQFVYAWSGKDLILLPVDCQEYKESTNFTNLQTKKITKDEMIPGRTYLFKDKRKGIYLGRHDYFELKDFIVVNPKAQYRWERKNTTYKYDDSTKYHIFVDADNINSKEHYYRTESGFTKVGEILDENIHENYAELLEKYLNSKFGSKVIDIKIKSKTANWSKIDKEGYLGYGNEANFLYINKENEKVILNIEVRLNQGYTDGKYGVLPDTYYIYQISGSKYIMDNGVLKVYKLNEYTGQEAIEIINFRKDYEYIIGKKVDSWNNKKNTFTKEKLNEIFKDGFSEIKLIRESSLN